MIYDKLTELFETMKKENSILDEISEPYKLDAIYNGTEPCEICGKRYLEPGELENIP